MKHVFIISHAYIRFVSWPWCHQHGYAIMQNTDASRFVATATVNPPTEPLTEMSWHGNAFCMTREFTGGWWIPPHKGPKRRSFVFFIFFAERAVEQIVELPVLASLWSSWDATIISYFCYPLSLTLVSRCVSSAQSSPCSLKSNIFISVAKWFYSITKMQKQASLILQW